MRQISFEIFWTITICILTGIVLIAPSPVFAVDSVGNQFQILSQSADATVVSSTSPNFQILGAIQPSSGDPQSANWSVQSTPSGSDDTAVSVASPGTVTITGAGALTGSPGASAIIFSGVAVSSAQIFLYRDDVLIATSTASLDGVFIIGLRDISPGSYAFRIQAISPLGERSSAFAFPTVIPNQFIREVSGINLTSSTTPRETLPTVQSPAISDSPIAQVYESLDKFPLVSTSPIRGNIQLKTLPPPLVGLKYIEFPDVIKSGMSFFIHGQSDPFSEIRIFIRSTKDKKWHEMSLKTDEQGRFLFIPESLPSGSYAFRLEVWSKNGEKISSSPVYQIIIQSQARSITMQWMIAIVLLSTVIVGGVGLFLARLSLLHRPSFLK